MKRRDSERESGLEEQLARHRDRLLGMVRLRLDPRLRGRVDPSDVVQDAFLEVTRRLGEFLDDASVPFYVWVRFLTAQKVQEIHRLHLGRRRRDVRRERPGAWPGPEASSLAIADAFVARGPSPSQAAVGEERAQALRRAIEELRDLDREVLVLRHFEELTNSDVARILGITPTAASLRYVRALERLGRALTEAGTGTASGSSAGM